MKNLNFKLVIGIIVVLVSCQQKGNVPSYQNRWEDIKVEDIHDLPTDKKDQHLYIQKGGVSSSISGVEANHDCEYSWETANRDKMDFNKQRNKFIAGLQQITPFNIVWDIEEKHLLFGRYTINAKDKKESLYGAIMIIITPDRDGTLIKIIIKVKETLELREIEVIKKFYTFN